MANITGLKALLRSVNEFIQWTFTFYSDVITGEIKDSPLYAFLNFILDNAVVFIFVVAVPLVGLGIGLLNRLIKSN